MPIIWRYRGEDAPIAQDRAWNDPEGRTMRTATGAVLPGPHFRGAEDVPERWEQGGLTRFQYAGAWAHALIGFAYALEVPGHTVYLDCSYAQLVQRERFPVPRNDAAMRPDILNRTTCEVWEIKPTTDLRSALREVRYYVEELGTTLTVRPGQSHIEGRTKLPGAPGRSAEIVYDMRMPGTVRYTVRWNGQG